MRNLRPSVSSLLGCQSLFSVGIFNLFSHELHELTRISFSALPPFPPFRLLGCRSFFSEGIFRPLSLLGLFILLSHFSFAQTCKDASIELSAVVQSNPPRITLNWVANPATNQYAVSRKLKNSSNWGPVLANFNGTATQFIDSTVSVNRSYEYRITRLAPTYAGYGYINAGIEMQAVESRGRLILVVDEMFKDSLYPEIEQLKADMEGDGWKVIQHNVSRDTTVTYVKSLIKDTYSEDVPNTKAVFLLGRIPVPYSGDIYPDAHPDHEGAWPADVYYAEMNGTWTDNTVDVIAVGSAARHHNLPGDGKFDQSTLPNDVELQIGRVDFANMPAFASSEQQLLKNYLDKDHAYRHKMFEARHAGVIDDNFGYFGTEAFAASGWKNFAPLVGPENVISDDYFLATRDSSFLWSYGCGGGSYVSAGGIGSTSDFAVSNLQSVFTMLFGSYFGDWDATNSFLRAPLAQGKTLTNAWSGRPHWAFHHMGLGENIGYSARISQNNSVTYHASYAARQVHIALMGDPTLRNHVVAPVADVVAVSSGHDAQISWTASPDDVLGYYLYVKSELNPAYVRLNDNILMATEYIHSCPPDQGMNVYMVRAITLQHSPSGTYYNLSQGITDTLENPGITEVQAAADYEVNGNEVAFTNMSLHANAYEWIFGDGQTSTEENPVHIYLDGYFYATLIAINDCDADTFHFEINIFTGVKDIKDDPSMVVAPNPSSGQFSLKWTADADIDADARIYSMLGNQIFSQKKVINGGVIDLTSLPEGMYIMHSRIKDIQCIQRLVIQH